MTDVTIKAILNSAADYTEELIDGRNHIVVNGVAIAEDVVEGSEGAVFYGADDLRDSDPNWDHKPTVIKHPKDANGKAVSANKSSILNASRVGFQLNTSTGTDGKQRFKAYIDEVKANQVDARLVANIKAGKKVEVSTGLQAKLVKEDGEFNGKAYKYRATNLKPDHLAILLDEVGAYSVASGGGLLANSSGLHALPDDIKKGLGVSVEAWLERSGLVTNGSMEEVKCQLYRKLSATYGEPGKEWYGFIDATFDDKVVFSGGRPDYKTMMVGFKATKDGVELVGDAVVVQSVHGYRSPDGSVLMANSSGVSQPVTESDMTAAAAPPVTNPTPAPAPQPAPVPTPNTPPVTNPTPAPQPAPQPQQVQNASFQTMIDQLKAVNPDFAYLVNSGLADVAKKRDALIATITNTPGNTFNPEWLKLQGVDMLDGLVKLATAGQQQTQQVQNAGAYPSPFLLQGVQGQTTVHNAAEEPLVAEDDVKKAA